MSGEEREFFKDAYRFLDEFEVKMPDAPHASQEVKEYWMDVHKEITFLSQKHASSFMNELLLSVFGHLEHLYRDKQNKRNTSEAA